LNVCVPPSKPSVAPALTVRAPLALPPPCRERLPALAWTEPVLLRATWMVVVPAADFLRAPLLLKAVAGPALYQGRAFWMSKVAPAALVKVLACCWYNWP